MKTRFTLALIALLQGVPTVPAFEPPKLVVAILVDQLRYDYLDRYSDQFTEGGFKLLTERGAFMTSAHYDYSPTVTAPGHATFLSGTGPAGHGIIGNSWFDKKTRRTMYCVEDSSVEGVGATGSGGKMSPRNFIGANLSDQMRLRYGSKVVGVSMKDRGAVLPAGMKPTGAYWFESKSGRFITSTHYMAELPAWVTAFNDRARPAEFIGKTWSRMVDPKFYRDADDAPGEATLAGEKQPVFDHVIAASKGGGFDNILPTPFGNQVLAEFAQAAVEGEKLGQGGTPDVLSVSFSSIDYCGHKFGPYSQEVQDMTLQLDRQLAGLFAYLDGKVGLDQVVIVLTADHGVAPAPEYAVSQGLDGRRLNEAEFMSALNEQLQKEFGEGKYFLNPRMSDGNLYYHHDTLREKKINPEFLGGFIREFALATGVYQAVYTRAQLLDGRAPGKLGSLVFKGYNAERSGDVVLVEKPFMFPSGGKSGTTHGSPYAYDTHVPVMFFGKPFKAGRFADEFGITDIAPTLSAALRVMEPPGSEGRACATILTNP